MLILRVHIITSLTPQITMKMKTKKEKIKNTRRVLLVLMTLLFILPFIACDTDTISNQIETPVEGEAVDKETKLITKYFLGDAVKVQLEEDGTYSLAGSDIRLFKNQLADTPDAYEENPEPQNNRSALSLYGGVRKWPNSTIVYRITGLNASVRSELQKSFKEWTNKTNIRFKERTNEPNYVTISSSGSNSNSGVATLGMFGSESFIRLGTRATAVVIIHEIGHALGYIHEHNSNDRDNHVTINFHNITNNAIDQFYKSDSAKLVSNQFDINSIMMYGSYTFSKNGQPTITDKKGNLLPIRQAKLSSLDIQGTNSIYPPVNNNGNTDDNADTDDNGTTDDNTNTCDEVKEWSPRKRYFVSQRATYNNRLYERDFTSWNFIKQCG